MKISLFDSTLSCTTKSIRFLVVMINRKIILSLSIFIFLGARSSPTAMLAPAYTLSSNGNIFQAGFSYGSSEMVKNHTGKTPIENLKEITSSTGKSKNIKKKTLESEDFYRLVKTKIEKTGKILNLSNQ